jgi:hypothetical protein
MSDFFEELVKKLPVERVYDDAASPSAKQTGKIAEDIAKCIHLALAPVQIGAAYQDRFRDFLDNSVRKVPEQNRIAPPPQILGPVLEGVKYEPEGSELEEMASNLLAVSMDKENVSKAHPSYPNIIRQLSRDEVVILRLLMKSEYYRVWEADLSRDKDDFGKEMDVFVNFRTVEENFPKNELYYPDSFSFYLSHLYHLGLAAVYKSVSHEGIVKNNKQTGTREKDVYKIQPFGREFAIACGLDKEE